MQYFRRYILVFMLVSAAQIASAQTRIERAVALPAGYGDIQLGMTYNEVTGLLSQNPVYGYRGESDVSMLPGGENRKLIETAGPPRSIFARSWFQFDEDEKLTVITIRLNPEQTDHYSIFSTLCSKYGDPDILTAEKTTWQDDDVIMSLERPLTLRYMNAPAFQVLQEASNVEQSAVEDLREHFLEGL